MKKDLKPLKDDEYSADNATDKSQLIYRGLDADIGAFDSVSPNGEIVHEGLPIHHFDTTNSVPDENDETELFVSGTEADVTSEDLEALGPPDLSMAMGDDEDLKHRIYPVDFSGDDLDVPGSELDDDQEELGSEDEENNSYTRGED